MSCAALTYRPILLDRGFFHPFAQAERPHVCPHLFDVGEAFLLRPALARLPPSRRQVSFGRPNRILLFVIDDDGIDRAVLVFRVHRGLLPTWSHHRLPRRPLSPPSSA